MHTIVVFGALVEQLLRHRQHAVEEVRIVRLPFAERDARRAFLVAGEQREDVVLRSNTERVSLNQQNSAEYCEPNRKIQQNPLTPSYLAAVSRFSDEREV